MPAVQNNEPAANFVTPPSRRPLATTDASATTAKSTGKDGAPGRTPIKLNTVFMPVPSEDAKKFSPFKPTPEAGRMPALQNNEPAANFRSAAFQAASGNNRCQRYDSKKHREGWGTR